VNLFWDIDGIAFVISHTRVLDSHFWVFRVKETSSAEPKDDTLSPSRHFSVQK